MWRQLRGKTAHKTQICALKGQGWHNLYILPVVSWTRVLAWTLGTIKARPRSTVRASNHTQYVVKQKYRFQVAGKLANCIRRTTSNSHSCCLRMCLRANHWGQLLVRQMTYTQSLDVSLFWISYWPGGIKAVALFKSFVSKGLFGAHLALK